MKKNLALIFILFISIQVLPAQNPIGLPDIINYTKQAYLAGSQNWDIKQDVHGIMYFGNSEGLLTFDGSYWKIYAMPNKTVVRAVEIGPDNKLYVGAQNELGYFSPDKRGELRYTSLLSAIPENERSFNDVWNIVSYGKDIFFRTSQKIFQLKENKFTVYANQDWRFMGISNNKLIAQDHSNSILEFRNKAWLPAIDQKSFPEDFLVTSFLPINNKESIIATLKNGIYLMKGNVASKIASADLNFIAQKNIYKSLKSDSAHLLLSTSLGGCFVVDLQGNITQTFSTNEGLQNNNIRDAFLDKDRNLWLGLDNGIDFLAFDNAIKHIYTNKENEGSGYAAIINNSTLYIGTSNGLYMAPVNNTSNVSLIRKGFSFVPGTAGQVWNLSEVNGQLLLGHHEGSFMINDNNAKALDNSTGFWNFFALNNHLKPIMVAGNYQGVNFYNSENSRYSKSASTKFESSRIIAINNNDIWVAHPYKGIYKVSYNSTTGNSSYTSYSNKGLSSANHYFVYKIKDKIVVPSGKNFYEYNPVKDSFQTSAFFNEIFRELDVHYMKEDKDGNIWFVSKKNLGVVDFSSGKPNLVYIPELNGKMVSGFEFIYPIDLRNVLVGGEKGFYHINYDHYKNNSNNIQVAIRNVKAIDETEQLVFAGYYGNEKTSNGSENIPELNYKWNSLHFEFSSNLYGQQSSVQYAYMLDGFDKTWSAWFQKSEKDYTNLPPGTYTFKVKARNNFGNESAIAEYEIRILPPWYRSIVAYIFYSLIALTMVALYYRRQKLKFKKQRIQFEEEQKHLQYMHQLELERNEQAIVKLNNERLETDINHKNKELAAATMHLVQKRELIHKIREALMKLLKNIGDEKSAQEFKKVIRLMTEDEKFDEDWDQFSFHFDRVHGDFLMSLKKKFPNITATEQKLCAYLRMHLSTKEMAQLMNISVRGVEISRYRLRKKLQIPTEVHLLNYLLDAVSEKQTAKV